MIRTISGFSVLLVFGAAAFSSAAGLGDVSSAVIKKLEIPSPSFPVPVTPPGVTISNYTTDEVFTFENDAKAAMDVRVNVLKAAGITTLGGRVVPLGNDYSFVIEYLPTVKNGAALPSAVTAGTYRNGAAYWLTADATEEMGACAANFRSAGVVVLGSYLYAVGHDSAFAVDYLQKNVLRPTQEYDIKFDNYTGGKFTFESDARDNIPAYLAMFQHAGVPAIRGKAVKRPDGDYAVTVEYPVKTNKYGVRPQYAVVRYDSREIFTFEKDALNASRASLAAFNKAGVPPLGSIARPEGRDYSFSVDFLVANIYQQGGVIPSAAIATYQSPETFTFDTEAKKAMEEKRDALNAAAMGVVGSAVTGSLGSYTYAIDYVTKAGPAR